MLSNLCIEYTVKECNPISVSVVYSRTICAIKAKDGTRNKTNFPSPAKSSAILRLVNVLPIRTTMFYLKTLRLHLFIIYTMEYYSQQNQLRKFYLSAKEWNLLFTSLIIQYQNPIHFTR